MKQGEKFIVIDNSGTNYNKGDIVELYIFGNSMYSQYIRFDNLIQHMAIYKLKPLEKFPHTDAIDNSH